MNRRSRAETRLGGDLFVDAEVLFDRCDADFELFALVDFVFFELGQLRVDAIDFCIELVEAAIKTDKCRPSSPSWI
jgi:hypothetical protein